MVNAEFAELEPLLETFDLESLVLVVLQKKLQKNITRQFKCLSGPGAGPGSRTAFRFDSGECDDRNFFGQSRPSRK